MYALFREGPYFRGGPYLRCAPPCPWTVLASTVLAWRGTLRSACMRSQRPGKFGHLANPLAHKGSNQISDSCSAERATQFCCGSERLQTKSKSIQTVYFSTEERRLLIILYNKQPAYWYRPSLLDNTQPKRLMICVITNQNLTIQVLLLRRPRFTCMV